MATRTGKSGTAKNEATIAHVMEMLASIEAQCRLVRLMLQSLDPSTPIPLSRETKALAKKVVNQPFFPDIC
jgi:hypothetical protein